MRATICTINVGGGEGNRNVVMEVMRWVDVLIVIDGPTTQGGEYVEHECIYYELVSFVKGSGVEVYIKREWLGWVTVEQDNEWNVVLSYKEMGKKERTRMAGVYLKPNRSIDYLEKGMKDLENCDIIMGDLNARNPIWGGKAGDGGINQHGKTIKTWTENNGFNSIEHEQKTFRTVSVIDLTLYKKDGKVPRVQLIDKMGLEHCGQVIRKCLEEPVGLREKEIAWKKVDWKEVEEKLKELDEDGEKGWEGLKEIVGGLKRIRGGVRNNDWWNDELENMAKDMKRLRREGSEDWKLVRKVFRNHLLQERYRKIRSRLEKTGEIEAFKMVRPLEGRRAIPPMQTPDGQTIFEFEKS